MLGQTKMKSPINPSLSFSQATKNGNFDPNNQQQLPKLSAATKRRAAAFALAKKGFSPLDRKKVEEQMESMVGEASEAKFQKAAAICLNEFFSKELAMTEEDAANIQIRGIFFPPMGKKNDVVNVEFWREDDVRQIQRHAKNLPNSDTHKASIVNFVPKELRQEYREVEEQAYEWRSKGPTKYHTRIWLRKEIELRVREEGYLTPWAKIAPTQRTKPHP